MPDTDDTPADPDLQAEPHDTASNAVTVYWRPGCPFCSMLFLGLRRAHVPVHKVNIWEDPEAAAFVRSVARGNETVPTVTVGGVSMVNPSAREVKALFAGSAR